MCFFIQKLFTDDVLRYLHNLNIYSILYILDKCILISITLLFTNSNSNDSPIVGCIEPPPE